MKIRSSIVLSLLCVAQIAAAASSPLPYDRIHETTTTTGTGALTLLGAAAACQTFSVIGNGNSCDYVIVDLTNNAWEVGTGTYTTSGNTLSRDKVRASSNSGALVNLLSGTKDVFVDFPADLAVVDVSLCQGRLTLTSNTPVTTTDVTGAGTIFFTPFRGNRLALWNGSGWKLYAFSQLSLSLSGLTAALPYDVFVYDNAGTLTLESVAWTNGTTRATALTTQDGVYAKSGTPAHRYLGTCYTTGTGTTEDSQLNRLVWNYYNRVRRPFVRFETTVSWTYASATTWRQANANTANQVTAVVGVAEEEVSLAVWCATQGGTTGDSAAIAIGTNSTTTPDPNCLGLEVWNYPQLGVAMARLDMQPAIGYTAWAWLELSPAGHTLTFYGNFSTAGVLNRQTGITGSIRQ